MIRVVAIAREYGSGGAELGQLIAARLGWEFLDRQLIDRVACAAGIDQKVAVDLDEHAHRWWQLVVAGMSYAAPYSTPARAGVIEEDFLQEITSRVIDRAVELGNCVIVGRGAQCLLQGRADVLSVLAYAPVEDRIQRLRTRRPDCSDFEALVKRVDSQRAAYVRQHYRRDWLDKSLYHLCINTRLGLELAAELVVTAIERVAERTSQHGIVSGQESSTMPPQSNKQRTPVATDRGKSNVNS